MKQIRCPSVAPPPGAGLVLRSAGSEHSRKDFTAPHICRRALRPLEVSTQAPIKVSLPSIFI